LEDLLIKFIKDAAEMNKDGKVNVADLTLLIAIIKNNK
jgi:hypothetical protein